MVAAFAMASPAHAQAVMAPQADSAALRARLAPTMAPPDRPLPRDAADLDEMLRQKDFGRLTNRLRAAVAGDDIHLDANWEQTQLYNGAGFAVAYIYMYDLWRLGAALPAPLGDQVKESAAMVFVYSLELIALDGAKCADASAPARRQDQLFAQNKDVFQYIRALPPATRMMLGTASLQIEAATASLRQNDPVLCGGTGDAAQDTKQFVDADQWGPLQTTARQAMPGLLTRLLTAPGDTSPGPNH